MSVCDFYKSVLEQDTAPIVLCDLDNTIIYMNSAAALRYADAGGMDLVGQGIRNCHGAYGNERIDQVVDWFKESADHNRIYTFRNDEENKDVYMVALRNQDGELIGYYEKHEYRTKETMDLYDFN